MKPEEFVDDNLNYMVENERYKLGEFDTFEEAIAARREMTDEFLIAHWYGSG